MLKLKTTVSGVTFRDPETSSLKTSFQEKVSLQSASRRSH
jgi:hypothetical protein